MTRSAEVGAPGAREGASGDRPARARLRIASVGVSTSPTCGVREYAGLLAEALGPEEVSCSLHWLQRDDRTLARARASVGEWASGLDAELQRERPDAVLLQYSVFSYSYRGVPLFVSPVLAAVRRSRVPLVTVLHEYAYPWHGGGVRGCVWAATQRAALLPVMRASAGVLVTIADRSEWLASRAWLPRRPTMVAPVFSTLPPPRRVPRPDRATTEIGLFGYSFAPSVLAVVTDALAQLERAGADVQLQLIGAPGRSSAVGQQWLRAAAARRLRNEPSFSGRLPAQELSDCLAACEILLFADPAGPMSRKTTLAAMLSSGRPLVALDGPRTWGELIDADAAVLAAPEGGALAATLAPLLADEDRRDALGARGSAFARRTMTAAQSARTLADLLEQALTARRS